MSAQGTPDGEAVQEVLSPIVEGTAVRTRFERDPSGGVRIRQWAEGRYANETRQSVYLDSAGVDAFLAFLRSSEP